MASTFSELKFELIGTGDQAGNWGATTNDNIGTAIEQAITGLGNPIFTTDANLTITLADTVALQTARALVLNITSSVSLTATRQLIVPTIEKQYLVQNNTTGGQSITVKTSAGTGITVPNGSKAHLYVNGVNVISAVSYLTDLGVGGTLKLTGAGANNYTPFAQTFSSAVTNFNGYQLNYIQNTNNGSDASADYVAYNDASDVDSYFIDMGIVSSNYSSVLNTVFPANSGYVYTGGGTSGQAAPLLFGTSNSASDITFFTGGTLLANTRTTIKGNTGNILIGTTTDTGYKLNVNGTTYFGGASTFGSTVLLNANPTLALQAATKQYVDAAASTSFVVHEPAVYGTTAALPTNTYNNGSSGVGATLTAVANGALTVDGGAVTASQRILVKNEVAQANNGVYTVTQAGSGILPYILTRATDFDTAATGEIANNAYFFITAGATQAGDSFVLSQTAAITVGTTALPFTLFADQAVYAGGTNITVAGQIISVSGTIAATLGGTGTSTVATGDLLYGSGTNTWSKLPLGAAYKSLIINASGTQVEWNAIPLNQAAAVSGTLAVANGGTGVTSSTGTGSNVLSTSPTLVTPSLGTPTSATLTNATGLPLTTGVTGLLPVANGGTGTATPALVAGTNVTITGTWPNQTIAASGGGGGGMPTGGGGNTVFYENSLAITTSYSITASKSAMSTGPITINTGATVTVPTDSRWVIL